MKKIKIITTQLEMEAKLNESKTTEELWKNLPLEGTVQTWGDEIYFGVPVTAEEENSVSEVNVGDIAYWPDGMFFCIFFGKTPLSTDEAIIPAGPVNVVGSLLGEPTEWRQVPEGELIKIEKA